MRKLGPLYMPVAVPVLVLVSLSLASLGTFAEAQELVRTWNVGGVWIDSSPDLDGDGFREIVLGDLSYGQGRGRVFVVSGRVANPPVELFSYSGSNPYDYLGLPVASLGDIDGDGLGDIAGGAQFGNSVVVNGKGRLLFEHATPIEQIAALNDLDSDGRADFLFTTHNGPAYVYFGGDSSPRHVIPGPIYGFTCVGLGDVSGDGIGDFAIGDPEQLEEFIPPGCVGVYSGATGGLLYLLTSGGVGSGGGCNGDRFGIAMAAPGDLNGDGKGDLVISGGTCDGSGTRRIYVHDGPRGSLLGYIEPPGGIEEAGDADGNGTPDLYVGQFGSSFSIVRIVDGVTRTAYRELTIEAGAFLGEGHDWNGDDFPDFLIQTHDNRRVWIDLFSGAPLGVRVLGTACSAERGRSPRIGVSNSAVPGADCSIHVSRVAPGLDALLVVGTSLQSAGLSGPRPLIPGCPRIVVPAAILRTRTTPVGPGHGAATIRLRIPPWAASGWTFYAQWILLSPGSKPPTIASTRILEIQVP